jgi:dTDP-4-dehydrorhamnose 3,5-epimerase
MRIEKTALSGVFLMQYEPHNDTRGFFMRIWDSEIAKKSDLVTQWSQESVSFSKRSNTVRGLHYQREPQAETKLVAILKGKILDVVVDIRPTSSTLGTWFSTILDEESPSALYIPKGFAHGFRTLTDNCLILYKMDVPYNPEFESGILWNDHDLNIAWGVRNPIISDRDSSFCPFRTYLESVLTARIDE